MLTLPLSPRPAPDSAESSNRSTTSGELRFGAGDPRDHVFRIRPLGRIAALFVTLARFNSYEGRDSTLVTDSLSCGVVADYLDMSVDDLARLLTELQARSLVEACGRGLRLKNLAELERLAEATD